MKTTLIDQIFISVTSLLIKYNSLGLISILLIGLSIIFTINYVDKYQRFDDGQQRWQNEYSNYLIGKFETQSDPNYLTDRQLIYFVVYSAVGMSTEIKSIRDDITPPQVEGVYSVWFMNQIIGPTEYKGDNFDYVIITRKSDTFVYRFCYKMDDFKWTAGLKIIATLMGILVFLYFFLWIIKSYYIKPIQNIAIEAFNNASMHPPKELSLDQYPYIQYIIESINRLLNAVKQKEQEILHYARSRFVVDSAKRITHNISNLMNPIDYHFEQLPIETHKNEHMKQIEFQFRKIQDQIKQLKKLNSNIINKEIYFVGSIVELIMKQLAYLEIEISYSNNSSTNGKCDIDPELIHDALYNVIKNAAEATKENGFKHVDIEMVNDVTFIMIIIKNNVPEDFTLNIYDIFEPFLSSKSEGLGIGASVSKRILELHEGELTYQHKDGFMITRVKIPKHEGS